MDYDDIEDQVITLIQKLTRRMKKADFIDACECIACTLSAMADAAREDEE